MGYRFTDTDTCVLCLSGQRLKISRRMLTVLLCFQACGVCQSNSHMDDHFPLTRGGRSRSQTNGAGRELKTEVKGNPIRRPARHVVLFGFRWESPNETLINEKYLQLRI